jgi:hypothetical protein
MLFVIIPLSVILLGVIIYIALSSKSSKMVRLAALCALGAIMLSIIVCAIVIFVNAGSGDKEPAMPDFLSSEPPVAASGGNFFALFILALFMVGLLGIIIVIAMRDRKR